MTNIQTLNVNIEDENERLDSFLSTYFVEFSRAKIQKQIEAQNILINNKPTKNSYRIKLNDKITILETIDSIPPIQPQNIPLDIKYEDNDIVVVNKPKNMLTHPTSIERENTLVNALLFHYEDNLSNLNGSLRPGIVHRLDRNTSGLLMIAKNNIAHEHLANQIKNKTIIKKYRAITHNVIEQDTGKIETFISRNQKQMQKMCIANEGKWSITEYKVLERFKYNTFVELNLITGRTHQIRVHLAHINAPIINDSLYSNLKFKVKTQEQVLQSFDLTFSNLTNKIINVQIEPDDDIEKVLRYLRNN